MLTTSNSLSLPFFFFLFFLFFLFILKIPSKMIGKPFSLHPQAVKSTLSKGRAWPCWPGPTLLGPGSGPDVDALHQENSKLLFLYLICLNPLNLKLSKIREEKRRGLDLFFLMFLNFFLILL